MSFVERLPALRYRTVTRSCQDPQLLPQLDPQLLDEQLLEEQLLDEQLLDEQLLEEQLLDEQLLLDPAELEEDEEPQPLPDAVRSIIVRRS